MIKAIFFDVDGTLLSHKTKSVPKSAKQAIETLRKKGIRCVVATGRHLLEMQDLPVSEIEFDSYITLNGQLCFDENKEVLFGRAIQNHEKELIIDLFNHKETAVMMIEKNRIYMNFVNDYVRKAQEDVSTRVFDCEDYSGNDIYMASVYIDHTNEDPFKEKFKNCLVTRWHDYGVDVVSKDGGKVAGIQEYLKMNHINQEETMAFGDGENDIEMLKYVHLGIAMGNAKEIVKENADDVTLEVDEDGIVYALKKYGLLNE